MTVTFKFEIDQKVKTVLGNTGMIFSAILDNTSQIQYYVVFKDGNSQYFKEDHLKAVRK